MPIQERIVTKYYNDETGKEFDTLEEAQKDVLTEELLSGVYEQYGNRADAFEVIDYIIANYKLEKKS